jgi:hypothetical protein
MAQKRETLRQREKAQKELLELKKMQQGVISTENLKKDEKLAPKTFGQKFAHFMNYHKFKVLAAVLALSVLVFIIYSTVTAPRYDGKVTVYCYEYFSEEDLTYIEEWITPYYPDVNENGENLLLVTDCSFSLDTDQKSYVDNMMLKIQSILSGQKDAMLFILDDKSIEYLNGISDDFILFTKENIVEIPESFYEKLPEGRYTFPNNKKRYVCLRTIGGTSLEGEKAKENYKAAKQVIEKLKKENPTAEDLFDTEAEGNIEE